MTEPLFRTTPVAVSGPWQIGLRTLFVLMALISVLLMIMGMVGLVWSIVLLWFLLLVSAHVVGNSWGKHDRQTAPVAPTIDSEVGVHRPAPLAADPAAVRLRQKAVFH